MRGLIEGCEAPEVPCKPQKGQETWTYANGSYARQGAPAIAETAPAAEPTTAPDLAARARVAMKAKRWADAVADFQKAFALDAELPHLRGELGWALFNAGQLADARSMTEAALAKAEKPGAKGALLYNLGRIDEAEKKPDQAIAHYKASLEARPKNDVVQKRLDQLLKAHK
ncbi:MAG: tetratricopeptide repeat protein [Myxococcota bacterium]